MQKNSALPLNRVVWAWSATSEAYQNVCHVFAFECRLCFLNCVFYNCGECILIRSERRDNDVICVFIMLRLFLSLMMVFKIHRNRSDYDWLYTRSLPSQPSAGLLIQTKHFYFTSILDLRSWCGNAHVLIMAFSVDNIKLIKKNHKLGRYRSDSSPNSLIWVKDQNKALS